MHATRQLAGARYLAGLGIATVLPDLDFETYSEAGYLYDSETGKWRGLANGPSGKGLACVGMAAYAMHASTEVLSLSYDLKDGRGPRRWHPAMDPPQDLFAHLGQGGLVEAWNAGFEWWIWTCVCIRKYGWPPLSYLQTRCAMAKAAAHCMPRALGLFGQVAHLAIQKDKAGYDLLKKFSVPQNPTKGDPRLRHYLAEHPTHAERLYAYNDTDIASEAEASSLCPDLTGEELDFWLVDQLINRRGVSVDQASLSACVSLVEQCVAKYNDELRTLTGGLVERASMTARLKDWLGTRGVMMGTGKGSGDEEAFARVIAGVRARSEVDADSAARLAPAIRAMELRQLIGSNSVKKVFAMTNSLAPTGRLHDLSNYHGARTGRPTGGGPQPLNLPKTGPAVYCCKACAQCFGQHTQTCPWCGQVVSPGTAIPEWWEAVDDALATIATRDLTTVEHYFGDALLTVSGCLRGLFVAAEGHDFICSDFSSIEGVVTAALAGEDWRVEMFETHGKAYELSVSKITGIPFAEIMASAGYDDVTRPQWWLTKDRKGKHHPLRQTVGKVAELASGFGGWIEAWKRFGAGEFLTDPEIKQAILKWREASPAIIEFWGGQIREPFGRAIPELFGLEGMFVKACLAPGINHPVRRRDGSHSGLAYRKEGDAVYCILPSGRAITYHSPRLAPNDPGDWRGRWRLTYEGYDSQKGQWVTIPTYAGKLCENVVQATARDIQRYAILNLERAGYHVVLHVYDEDVAEVPHGWGSVEELERIMCAMPDWAQYKGRPWPIKAAGGWRGRRYRKA